MNIKTILGDSLEILPTIPDGSIDAVVTDPPYGSGFEWDQATLKFQEEWISQVPRILKEGGSFYCFFGIVSLPDILLLVRKYLDIRNLLVWHHPNLYGSNLTYGKDRWKLTWEAIVYAVKGKNKDEVAQKLYLYDGRSFDVIIEPAVLKGRLHKAQKPLNLIKKLVVAASEPGDTILDPFGGSGTTAVACKLLERNCIIVEKDPNFYQIMVERINSVRCFNLLF